MNISTIVVIVIIILIVFFVKKALAKEARLNSKLDAMRQQYKDQDVFLCHSFHGLSPTMIQLWGESTISDLKPGMRMLVGGRELEIFEVYDDDESPEFPDPEVPAGTPNTPIVFKIGESPSFLQSLNNDLKKETVVALNIRQ